MNFRAAGRRMSDAMGAVDDAVQGTARRVILGKDQSTEGAAGVPRTILSQAFYARPGSTQDTAYKFTNDREGQAAMYASRALQAGGVTAAGISLMAVADALTPTQTSGTLMP